MRKVLQIFFQADGTRPVLVLFFLLVAILVQGVGLASMLPVISIALEAEGANAGGATSKVLETLDRFGIPRNVYLLLALSTLAVIIKNALTLLAMTYVGYAVAHISTELRRVFVDRLLSVRWSYLTGQPMGEVSNSLSGEASRAGQAYQSSATFIVYLFQATLYVAIAMFVSWEITTMALVAGTGIAYSMGHFIRRGRRAGRLQTIHGMRFLRNLSDALNNIKPLKAMNRQRNVAFLLERSIAGLRKALRRQVVAKQALKSGNEALAAIVMGVGIAIAIGALQIPAAELIVLAVVLSRLVASINKVQSEYQKTVILESAYFSIMERIEDLRVQREVDDGTIEPSFEIGCRLQNVSFSHPGRPVLDDVTLDFPVNRTTVLTGPSGAGKTTVADLLLGFAIPDQGQVLVDGKPLAELSLKAWRNLVGYVPQELILFNETVFQNITLGDPDFGEEQVREALRLAGGLAFVDALPDGIWTQVGEKGAQLSGGQRQRIAFARALIGLPKLLILDEVTSALDPETEVEIVDNIRSLQGHTTIIAITHRAALLDVADHVHALQMGKIAEAPLPARRAAVDVV